MPKKLTKEQFIEKAKQIHGNKYDYSKVEYKNSATKVCIICPEHGEFWQVANSHIEGKGCFECSKILRANSKRITTEEFIKRAKEVHGDKYDYSNSYYIDSRNKICITCYEHGEFWQEPYNHLNGSGCPKCKSKKQSERQFFTTEEFIKRAKEVHGDKYDYSNVEYINSRSKIKIICNKCGNIFFQVPNSHLLGCGCNKCNNKSKGETAIKKYLENANIEYIYQYRNGWLDRLSLDFFIPKYNIGIEYDGLQHFEPIDFFGGSKEFLKTKERDKRKNLLCEKNNIKLIRISYDKFNDIDNILREELNEINT